MTSPARQLTREQVLGDLAETLEEDVEGLDENTDLVSLGLDSIRMMHLMVLWHRYGVEVTLQDLSANPTLGGWWEALGLSGGREQG
ncbi:phosphopantetheine-binding protein [Streptomyces sp. NPDC023723]|uniref:phosphopantetheine-binding protein n=1 Tax=Streptomyces sp. NPDC023723 TaxID=3154323 RepID=UPI0033E7B003